MYHSSSCSELEFRNQNLRARAEQRLSIIVSLVPPPARPDLRTSHWRTVSPSSACWSFSSGAAASRCRTRPSGLRGCTWWGWGRSGRADCQTVTGHSVVSREECSAGLPRSLAGWAQARHRNYHGTTTDNITAK